MGSLPSEQCICRWPAQRRGDPKLGATQSTLSRANSSEAFRRESSVSDGTNRGRNRKRRIAAVSLVGFFARELAPTHRRGVEAVRTALKATVTTAVSATLQILGPFGPLFAFVIGQPGISLGLSEGGLTIAVAAAIQAAIVPIT